MRLDAAPAVEQVDVDGGIDHHLHVEQAAQPRRVGLVHSREHALLGQMRRQIEIQALVALLVVHIEKMQRAQDRPAPTRANKASRTAASLL